MTESLASTFPTVLLYVVDTPRSADPTTFMSNMMYACSILYKTRLPFVVVFNKTDVLNHGVRAACSACALAPAPSPLLLPPAPPPQFAEEWMSDFDAFQDALDKERSKESYMTSLTRSMSLVLDEFYTNLRRVGVSAATGLGMEDLMEAIDGAVEEYRVRAALAPISPRLPPPSSLALTLLPRGLAPDHVPAGPGAAAGAHRQAGRGQAAARARQPAAGPGARRAPGGGGRRLCCWGGIVRGRGGRGGRWGRGWQRCWRRGGRAAAGDVRRGEGGL